MAERIRVERLCDIHEALGEEVEARWVSVNLDGTGPMEILLCEQCIATYITDFKGHLLEHGVKASDQKAPSKHQCPACGRSVPTRSALYSHVKRVHHTTVSELEGRGAGGSHPCPQCSRTFPTAQGVTMHLVRRHNYRRG